MNYVGEMALEKDTRCNDLINYSDIEDEDLSPQKNKESSLIITTEATPSRSRENRNPSSMLQKGEKVVESQSRNSPN